jgi:regulator of replication initiation timing
MVATVVDAAGALHEALKQLHGDVEQLRQHATAQEAEIKRLREEKKKLMWSLSKIIMIAGGIDMEEDANVTRLRVPFGKAQQPGG